MNVRFHKTFKKHFKLRIEPNPLLDQKFGQRLELLLKNPTDPILKDHELKGKKIGYRSFSVTGDIRVLYQKIEDDIVLYDIGAHNQVY